MKRRNEKFFLILAASGGSGHLRAADALHTTAALTGLPIRTESYDVLDFTSPVFKRLYSESYLSAVNRIPDLWGYFYARSEFQPYKKKGFLKLFDHLNYRKYLAVLDRLKPDAVICTHFLPYIAISNEVRGTRGVPPFYAVTTDFDAHSLWVDPLVRRYFVFDRESQWQLQSKGVSPEMISISGIPVHKEFSQRNKPQRVRKRLELAENRFTVLALSGGFGTGRIIEMARSILTTMESVPQRSFSLIVVCGKNQSAQRDIGRIPLPSNVAIRVLGFVNNIHELMDASDLLISKSGGLTSSEALAKGLPMIVVDPIPGQESRNADMLVEHGAAWKAINLPNLSFKLRVLLEHPAAIAKAHTAALRFGKPRAAVTILNEIYRDVLAQEGS